MAKEIAEEYASSLADLTVNSKPLINMLTILAEENVDHAGVIVDTVDKHLEKVASDIKLPVLYLVDSIIKNVGGAYTQKFSQIIVSMFTKTFKAVDEKTRSQMFKLRETWHEVFPTTKLYQLDVKVNLIDPAWPIQAQPTQANIHFNPNFLKKPAATTSSPKDEDMRLALAQKEQELLMLQKKKIEMELEQARRQLHLSEKVETKVDPEVVTPVPALPVVVPPAISVKQRLGPPVSRPAGGRIAPVSGAMLAAVRDPRLARLQAVPQQPVIAPNVFDIKPLDRNTKFTKRKNVITIDVAANNPPANPNENGSRDPRNRRERYSRNRDVEEKQRRAELKERYKLKLEEKRKTESASHKKRESDKTGSNRRNEDAENSIKSSEKEKPTTDDKNEELDVQNKTSKTTLEQIIPSFLVVDAKRINKLPPIPKLSKSIEDSKSNHKKHEEPASSPSKKKKDTTRTNKKNHKKRDGSKDSEDSLSPEKRLRNISKESGKSKHKVKEVLVADKAETDETISFKELKNYHKERYMRRNKEKSESPEKIPPQDVPKDEPEHEPEQEKADATNGPEIVVETMDVDLRQLPPADAAAAIIGHKRPSTETMELKNSKKHKFDILFGSEDVDLRQLPQVEETKVQSDDVEADDTVLIVPPGELSPKQKDWAEVKEQQTPNAKKNPSQLDVVRAKLAEATKGKDRLGRNLRFSTDNEKRHISTEDVDLRIGNNAELDPENDKESIKIIISQAEEQYKEGNINKEQYNTLMFQVLQISERLKLKEAKQRESLEVSKLKLLHSVHRSDEESDETSPQKMDNNFGDIDERVTPMFPIRDPLPDVPDILPIGLGGAVITQDSDLRVANDMIPQMGPMRGFIPRPMEVPPMHPAPHGPRWRGGRNRMDDYNGPRGRMRGPMPPYMRNHFERGAMNFEHRLPIPLPPPVPGQFQGESPLLPYDRPNSPPPLGASGVILPTSDIKILEYIDKDPMKTIEIDGVSREIRYYGETAIVMLDWDNPREIRFLPGSRRITFDNKDSIVLNFNEGYTTVEVDDQEFNIRYGAPTRELYVNGKWYECFFGGPPSGIIIDGVPRVIQLEGPPPKVDIGTDKRIDLVAGKINMIVDAKLMCPVFLDAKPQKFILNNIFNTIRFVDSFKTVLINEVPFKVEFGGLPRPIFIGKTKHFIRFSVLPRYVRPGHITIANMEGKPAIIAPIPSMPIEINEARLMQVDQTEKEVPNLNLEGENSNPGLDVLASVMPSSMAPASQFSGYSLGSSDGKIPGLETPSVETAPSFPIFGMANINVNDLFTKLVATGIVPSVSAETKLSNVREVREKPDHKKFVKEDRTTIKHVNLLKPETLRVKQSGIVAKLYGGMQCSGCGNRFPPEQTVKYSQHLDWHFRQNRRERDSARRAHSRSWHYDLSDWVQYEEVEDLDEREKSYFETVNADGEGETKADVPEGEAPSVPAGAPTEQFCALCGDKFDQFYNEDQEEWHLRRAVRHLDNNYHPLCFQEVKNQASKEEAKEEENVNDSVDDPSLILIEKEDLPIEVDDRSQSDTESVVEVLDDVEEPQKITDIEVDDEDGDEDDVVLKAEPVVQVVVNDDADTDDETQGERAERDKMAAIDFARIKIKQEPADPDDEPVITVDEQSDSMRGEMTSHIVHTSIDGNVQHEAHTVTIAPTTGIRINISKLPVVRPPVVEEKEDSNEPLPPGEEIEPEYTLKPAFEGIRLISHPPIQKGSELSGLCSIM